MNVKRLRGRMAAAAQAAAMLALLMLGAAGARAQVFELRGGSSTLLDTHGGSLQLYGEKYTARVGLGFTDGEPRWGLLLTLPYRGMQWDLGDQAIPFVLPTDLANRSYSFFGRGVGITRKRDNDTLFLFAGGTSEFFSTPFLTSAKADTAAMAIFWERRLTPALRFSSRNIFSGTQTSIQALEWQAREDMKVALAGGIGNSQSYWASSVDWNRDWISVQAGYARAGRNFRRVRVRAPQVTESDREMLRIELRPRRWIGFNVQRQNYLVAGVPAGQNPRVGVTGFGAWGTLLDTQLHGSWYRSRGASGGADSLIVGGRRRISSRIEMGADYLTSRPQRGTAVRAGVITTREILTPRFSLTQVISLGGGQKTVAFGGNFQSNLLTLGVEYQTVFTPLLTPGRTQFRQVLGLTIRLQLPHNLQAAVDTQVSPLGETRYSAHMTGFLYRGFGAVAGGKMPSNAFAENVIRGRVVDEAGQPISGAALRIDAELVFTDSQGQFFLRRKKERDYTLEVALDQFMLPGKYEVVSAPSRVRAEPEERATVVEVLLRRVPAQRKPPWPAGRQRPHGMDGGGNPLALSPIMF